MIISNKKMNAFIALVLIIAIFPFGFFSHVRASDDAQIFIFDSEDSANIINSYSVVLDAGDLNGDGRVTSLDSALMKNFLIGGDEAIARIAADVNRDGRLSAKDSRALKILISRGEGAYSIGNTALSKSFDSEASALKLSVSESGAPAFFEIDTSVCNSDNKFVSIVWKGADSASFGYIDKSYSENISFSCETDAGSKYGFVTSELLLYPEKTKHIEVEYKTSPEFGDELYIDCVIFAKERKTAERAAAERIALRKSDTPDIPSENKYITVNFDSESCISDISASNHTTASYSAAHKAMKLQITGAAGDPWALLDLEKYGISADEYKYIVYNSMIPSENHEPMPEGELFYAAGDISGPTGGYSNVYSQIKDGKFHSKIFEMSNAEFWKGTVHSLRLDYYCSAAIGDSHYVSSIVFCNTYEAALDICVDRDAPTTDIKQLFGYGLYDSGSFKMPYRTYVPYDYDSSKEYPVLMLLHGAGERGSDGTYHLTSAFPYLFSDTSNSSFNSIVIAPQCPEGYRWVETDWTLGNYSVDAVPESLPMTGALSVLYGVFDSLSVDRNRVYASGLSMGGFGTWDLLTRHSDIFAAGVPVCGSGDPSKADILKDIPIRTFHGTADNIVPARGTKAMYDAITAAGGTKIWYTPYGGAGHDIWDNVYKTEWIFGWLFSQSLADR